PGNGKADTRGVGSSSSGGGGGSSAGTSSASLTGHALISAWLVLSTLLVAWDTGYMLLRPRTFPGGDLFFFWQPYALYATVDLVYSEDAYREREGFSTAQSTMNVVESVLNLLYLYLAHVAGSLSRLRDRDGRTSRAAAAARAVAPPVLLAATAMTASKTILYFLNDHFCGWCKTGHNDWRTFVLLWFLPNSPWIIVPSIIAVLVARDIARRLYGVELRDLSASVIKKDG
ncbi:hypothetical protein HK405_010810, partial [Cladochytrium tenue]